jgi:D-alanyl-D-alanine-carboxypeptidase/D-alanyl-D-alanine-endopeptidase
MRILLSAVLALLARSASVSAQAPLPRTLPADSTIRAMLQSRVSGKLAAGFSVALVDSTGATRIISAGTGASGAPIDARTVFEIGSITKTFTGAALSSLVADGTVRLEQPVSELLPAGTVIPSRNGKVITLLDLATQRSGLPGMPTNFAPKDGRNPYADYTGERMLAFLASHQLTRDPGERYEYSNLGLGLLGYALASKTGQSYESLVRSRVLRPLGMTETSVALSPPLRARLAPGHDATGSVVANWDLDALAGAGALRSTATDMLRYLAANLAADRNARDGRTGGIGATLASAHTVRFTGGPANMALGLAWHRLLAAPGDTIVWHNGMTGGYASFLGYSPSRGLGVVILSNSAVSPDDIGIHLLTGRPLAPPSRPKSATRTTITLPPETLDRYVGEYPLAPTFVITVRRDGTRLLAQATGQPAFELFPASPTVFFLRVVEAEMEFELDASGTATALTLVQGGARQRAVKR